jgi:uncharacterized protein
MIHQDVQIKLPDIIATLKKHRVEKAYLFGSVCTELFSANSDVDFLIRFDTKLKPKQRGAFHLNLYDALEQILQRKVDLVTDDFLTNPYFIKVLNRTKTPLYE